MVESPKSLSCRGFHFALNRALLLLALGLFLMQASCATSGVDGSCTNNEGCDEGLICSAGSCVEDDTPEETPIEEEETPEQEETPTEEEPTTDPEEPEPEEPSDLTGPIVTFDSPDAYEMVSGNFELRFSVSDESGVNLTSVAASVEGVGPVSLNTVADNTFSATVDTSNFGNGLVFPLISIGADDALGNHSSYARRFGVDNRISVDTTLGSNQVSAGDEVTVTCVVSRAQTTLTDVPTQVTVVPSVAGLTQTDSGATFTPTTAGLYRAYCATMDGSAMDIDGKELRVIPASAASVETLITEPNAKAGDRIPVECRVFDAHGNQLISPQGLSLTVAAGVDTHHLGGQLFAVAAYTIGTYNVACSLSAIVDPSPQEIVIAPADPALSTTLVSINGTTPAAEVVTSPTDDITVHCSATDAYGNAVTTITTHFSVIPSDGQPAAAYGVGYTATGFNATRAGHIYAVCGVDGFNAEDDTPALVQIVPGLPFVWNVSLAVQDCYWAGRNLPMAIDVYDYWGNRIESPPISISTIPAGGVVTEGAGTYRVGPDGDYDVTLSVDGPHDTDATIADHLYNIRVDSTPPAINITSPSRADSFQQSSASMTVEGTISDSVSAVVSATVNEQVITITGPEASINVNQTQTSRWGLNVVTAQAEDECGNSSVLAQSYLRSPSYFSAATSANSGARVSQGIAAQINQPIIDDNDRSDNDDLASLGQTVMQGIDLDASIPNPMVASPDSDNDGYLDSRSFECGTCVWSWDCWTETNKKTGYQINRNGSFQYNAPTVEYIRAVDGGLKIKMVMTNLNLPVSAMGNVDFSCAGETSATVSGNVLVETVTVEGTAAISTSNGTPNVDLSNVTVTFYHPNASTGNPYIDIDWGILDFVGSTLNSAVNGIIGAFAPNISNLLQAELQNRMEPLVEQFLADFNLATSLTVPAPVNMTVNIDSAFDYLNFSGPENSGYGGLGLYTQIHPSSRGSSIASNARGSIRRDGSRPAFSSSAYEFGIGLKDDLINQVLWATWYGGGLDIPDAGSLIGQDNIDLSFEALSPPVLMPGSGGHQIEIGIGDAHIQASVAIPNFGNLDVSMYTSAIIGGSIDFDPTTNSLIVSLDSSNPQIWVQIDQIDEPALQGNMSLLFTEVMEMLVPQLLTSIVGSIPLPTFDVGGLAGLPNSEVWELTNGGIDRTDAYYRLTGSLD